jgi:hypothetical protein
MSIGLPEKCDYDLNRPSYEMKSNMKLCQTQIHKLATERNAIKGYVRARIQNLEKPSILVNHRHHHLKKVILCGCSNPHS